MALAGCSSTSLAANNWKFRFTFPAVEASSAITPRVGSAGIFEGSASPTTTETVVTYTSGAGSLFTSSGLFTNREYGGTRGTCSGRCVTAVSCVVKANSTLWGVQTRLITKDWYPGEYYIQPHYSTMPSYLRVEDVFAPTLGPRKRRFWTKARDQALSEVDTRRLPVGDHRRHHAVRPRPGDAGHRGGPSRYRRVGGVRVPAVSGGSPRLRLGPRRRRDLERRMDLEVSRARSGRS